MCLFAKEVCPLKGTDGSNPSVSAGENLTKFGFRRKLWDSFRADSKNEAVYPFSRMGRELLTLPKRATASFEMWK